MIKTRALLFWFLFSIVRIGHGQPTNPPPIEWQRSFGGTNTDDACCIRQISDGGYIVSGLSSSGPSGNKTSSNFGGSDFWIVRLDQNGNQLWDRSFGGTSSERYPFLRQTTDGGFIVGGGSWIVRLDSNGDKIWDTTCGTTNYVEVTDLQQIPDGRFMIAGWTQSAFGIPTDGYVASVDAGGNKLWDRTFGSGNDDKFWCLEQTADDGFMLGGTSHSFSSGGTPRWGSWDFWLVKLDRDGNKLWEKFFGGSQKDEMFSLQQTAEGGFILGGNSVSGVEGNKTSPFLGGNFTGDFWIVHVNADGNQLWDKSFGGVNDESLGLGGLWQTADRGLILAGDSTPEFNSGPSDVWVVRLDAEGNKLWEQTFGGSSHDRARSVQQTRDGGFIIGGYSRSPADGNKTTPQFGGGDFWVIKLAPDSLSVSPRLRAQPQSFDAIRQNGYRFFLSGVLNHTYVIEYSESLNDWAPLQTNHLTSAEVEITDAPGSDASQRFYRARLLP